MIWSSEEKFKEPRYKTQWYNKFKENTSSATFNVIKKIYQFISRFCRFIMLSNNYSVNIFIFELYIFNRTKRRKK